MGCELSKLTRMQIHFDNELLIFQSGEVMNGYLLLEVQQEITVYGGEIYFIGKAETAWIETDRAGNLSNMMGSQTFFQQSVRLFGAAEDCENGTSQFVLTSGLHKFPFEYTLPLKLPSSFELCGDTRGRIQYVVRVEIENCRRTESHILEKVFLLLASVDLRSQPKLNEEVSLKKKFEIACCCIRQGSICCKLSLNKTAFVPGETLKIDIEVNNQSSAVVRSTCISFEQRTMLFSDDEAAKQVSALIFNITGHQIKSGGTACYHDVIHVPPLPPNTTNDCNLVHVDYLIQVTIDAQFLLHQDKKIELSLPIVIGSIPQNSAFSDNSEIMPCFASFDYNTGDIIEYQSPKILELKNNNEIGLEDTNYIKPAYRYFKTEKRFVHPRILKAQDIINLECNKSFEKKSGRAPRLTANVDTANQLIVHCSPPVYQINSKQCTVFDGMPGTSV